MPKILKDSEDIYRSMLTKEELSRETDDILVVPITSSYTSTEIQEKYRILLFKDLLNNLLKDSFIKVNRLHCLHKSFFIRKVDSIDNITYTKIIASILKHIFDIPQK